MLPVVHRLHARRFLVSLAALLLPTCTLMNGAIALADEAVAADAVASDAATAGSDVRVRFATQIRPILSENCFFCHGTDPENRRADLRLDTEDGAADVIVAGDAESSELYARLVSDDQDTLMPPPDSHRTLTSEQIDLVRRWIEQGARWEKHWSYRRIQRPAPPQVRPFDAAPIRNPIDQFVTNQLRRQANAGGTLRPMGQANRRTLIRRLSLDLTGLPPSPSEVQAFLKDHRPDAYPRLVDRLLDSPAYGQRMAWDWLDAARYADTNGYQGDNERTMWPWRDWVVRAFNENMPLDEFAHLQLAGDLMPDAKPQQILPTAFLRNHPINGEGGRIAQ
ncbi:MAG: DUF1549 domain-containing protein, partial [Planctomycetota bacterium]